jgi:3-oxoacyl-[acyl-carrier-protein] synthase III
MTKRIISIATRVGNVANQFGAFTEPVDDEITTAVDVATRAIGHVSDGGKVDRIIFAHSGIRQIFPSGAIAIASNLFLNCVAFDVAAACASMSIAVEIAASMSGRTLVVSADSMSRTIDPDNPSHLPLRGFGDGAAAVMICDKEREGLAIIAHQGITDGRWVEFYGSANGKLLRALPSDRKPELRASYVNSWAAIFNALVQKRTQNGPLFLFANQGDKMLFPELIQTLGLSKEQLIVTDHGHAGGADPWIGLHAHPIPIGSSAILLASGIGFAFHGILLEQF